MMGKRGPKPLPTLLKKARGTFRADRAPANEPTAIGKPTCPKLFPKNPEFQNEFAKEFRRLAKLLGDMGVVGAADQNLLTRYAVVWVRWRRSCQLLASSVAAETITYRDGDGQVKAIQVSALHTITRSLGEELSRAEGALGMTPSSRSRMEVAVPTVPVTAANPEKSKTRFFDGSPLRIAR